MSAGQALMFSPGKSVLHRANPITKLCLLIWAVSLAFVPGIFGLWALTAALLALGAVVLPPRRLVARFLVMAAPFLLALFLFHGLILPRPDAARDGWLGYSPAGLAHAGLLGGRVALMLAGSLLFAMTTHPADLLRAFDAAHWPPALAYLLAAPLLLLEEFGSRTRAIRDAQASRGLNLGGSPANRLRGLSMLVVPLITSALADAHERADVLTARGFRALPWRSVLQPPPDSALQRVARIALVALAVLQIGYALWR